MKKYLLTVILALTVLLVGCESGLKIKDQITTVFTTEDKAKFTGEYIPYLKSEAAKHGYIVNEPILNTDVVMEAVVTESSTGDTATFRLAVDNGEYVWTEEYTESGEVVEKFSETYTDMATWLFCVTHDIETRWIEGQIYDVMYVADGADHLSGYLFNKSTLKYDDTKKIASVDLWDGTDTWKTVIDYNISGSGDVIGVSEYDENGNETQYKSKITWNVDGVQKDVIIVNDFVTNTWKVYVPTSLTTDLSISGAILIREDKNTENGGYSKEYNLNGELIMESTHDGNGNNLWKRYNGEVLTERGYTENGTSYNYYKTTSPAYDSSTGNTTTEDVLVEKQWIQTQTGSYSIERYYYNANLTTLEKSSNSVCIYEWNESTGVSNNYDITGNLISTETYRSTKSASKAKQVASPVTTVNNIEEIQKMLTQNVKKGW